MYFPFKLLIGSAICSLAIVVSGQAQGLTLLGSPDFAIQAGASEAPYTQGPSSFTINGAVLGGQGVGGGFLNNQTGLPRSYDWSGVLDFALVMSIGSPINRTFTLEFFDSSQVVGIFRGDTSSLTSSFTELTLTEDFRSDLSAVIGMQFAIDDDSTISNLIVAEIVPEPSTWALVLLGSVSLGVHFWRRKTAALRR